MVSPNTVLVPNEGFMLTSTIPNKGTTKVEHVGIFKNFGEG